MNSVSTYEPERILSSKEGEQLIAWTNSAIEAGADCLLIDLSKTSFMDSSGLGALVAASKKAHEHNKQFALCSLNGQTRMLLEITCLEQVFEVYGDRTEFERQFAKDSQH